MRTSLATATAGIALMGIFADTRRVGAVVSGPIIARSATSALGYGGVFAVSAAMTAVALVLVVASARTLRQQQA